MTHWKRKHIDNLAYAIKRQFLLDDTPFRPHRQDLIELYGRAKHAVIGSQNPSDLDVREAIIGLCDICKRVGHYNCAGRDTLERPCPFVAENCR